MSQKEEQWVTMTARWWSILKSRRQTFMMMLQSAKKGGYGKKRFSRPIVAVAICLLVLLLFVGILLVVLEFTVVGWTKSNNKSCQNAETHDNQGPAEHDEYYSSKCPEEFAMIYPEWHSNQCRLPHRHHPWFNIIRDELIDDQSVSRTYPPWGNRTCVKEWYGKAIRPSTPSKRAKKHCMKTIYKKQTRKQTKQVYASMSSPSREMHTR